MRRSRVNRRNILFGLFAFFLTLLMGCESAKYPPRQQARSAVIVTAEAVRIFSQVCAGYVIATEDQLSIQERKEIAESCVQGYDAARFALIGTADAVDKWDSSQPLRDNVICSIRTALDALARPEATLFQHDVKIPILEDARRILIALGPCNEVVP